MSDIRQQTLRGIGVSPGIAVGSVLILEGPNTSIFRVPVAPDRVPREITRLKRALAHCRRQILQARERALREAGEGYARVFDAQLLILEDSSLVQRDPGHHPEGAGQRRVGRARNRGPLPQGHRRTGGPLPAGARGDVEDVHARLQRALSGRQQHDLSELKEDVIVVSRMLSPSDLMLLNRDHVMGLAIEQGGQTSHTAIIASALRVPAVVGLRGITSLLRTGDPIVLDGATGTVRLHPTPQLLEEYREAGRRVKEDEERLMEERDLPAVTADGAAIRLQANLEIPEEAKSAVHFGAEGVGLYRSEFLFLHHAPDLPTEEDHHRAYRTIADRMAPHPVIIRTLDLGGEKYFHRILEREEANPVMGLRAIRFCLRRKDIFRTQLRGFLRAAAGGGLALMFPMICDRDELVQAKDLLENARRELRSEGIPVPERFPLGAMIETPAAAAIADILAREVDFFSIGTNDLIQYSMAIDRGNPSVSYLYRPLHPAMLRLIKGVIDAARATGRQVSLCGEMAADPLCAALLLGMGITEMSMKPSAIPAVKHLLRSLSLAEAKRMAREAMTLSSSREIEDMIQRQLGDRLPHGYACVVHSG